jgi:hypothetical protein
MLSKSVLLCVHGYTKAPREHEKPWQKVVKDRLSTAFDLAKFFNSIGVTIYLVLSGGSMNGNQVEADVIHDYARKEFSELFAIVNDVILERESKNTQENVDEILKWALKKNAAIISISSKDHASRVIKDWAYDKGRNNHLIMVAPSHETYGENENSEPIIIEPSYWAYDALKDIFNVPEDKRKSVKEKLIKDLKEL